MFYMILLVHVLASEAESAKHVCADRLTLGMIMGTLA